MAPRYQQATVVIDDIRMEWMHLEVLFETSASQKVNNTRSHQQFSRNCVRGKIRNDWPSLQRSNTERMSAKFIAATCHQENLKTLSQAGLRYAEAAASCIPQWHTAWTTTPDGRMNGQQDYQHGFDSSSEMVSTSWAPSPYTNVHGFTLSVQVNIKSRWKTWSMFSIKYDYTRYQIGIGGGEVPWS
jgi:hypothetical protein